MLKQEVVSDVSLSYSSGSSPELPSMLDERPGSNSLQQINGSAMPTTCAICGEACSCYHYNVPSCNSCKTFFRRNVLSNRKMACKANGRCDIIQGDRCRSCRFDRCLLAGMDPFTIKLPDNFDLPKLTHEMTARRKRLVQRHGALAIPDRNPVMSEQTEALGVVDLLFYLETKSQRLRRSTYNPVYRYTEEAQTILRSRNELGHAESYEEPSNWPIDSREFVKWMPKSCHKRPGWNWLANDAFVAVEMAKALPVFQKLDTNDQIALLSEIGLVNLILTEAFYSYQQRFSALMMPDGLIPIQTKADEPNQLEVDVFCRVTEPLFRVGLTTEEYVLLKAIIYCHSATADVSPAARELLEAERHRYSRILLQRLQTTLGAEKGAKKYVDVISLMDAFFHFSRRHRELDALHVFMFGMCLDKPAILKWILATPGY